MRKGLSAGRVQSAALKIICDREKEIRSFVPEEYWTITAEFNKKKNFTAKLSYKNGKKIKISSKEENDKILEELSYNKYSVSKIIEKPRVKKPYAPFTTSSMQQDAANKLNFNTRKTMVVAQQLYEGIDVGKRGTMGLITYLRTDSVRVSDEAKAAAASYVTEEFGEEYSANNIFSSKRKDVQDAHEAIRPSDVNLKPEGIKEYLSGDQFKLYKLIWTRFVASQMAAARYDSMQVDIENGKYRFRANGSKRLFDGYQKVYKTADEEKDNLLPELNEGEELKLIDIKGE